VARDRAVVCALVRGASVERRERAKVRPHASRGGAAVAARAEVGERLETAHREPDLIGLGVVRPRAAEHDQLDLVGRVSHAPVGGKPIPGLEIGIEAVVLGPLGPGLVGEVALGHADVVRAEDAGARARERLGQHRDRRDARERAHGAHAQPAHEILLEYPPVRTPLGFASLRAPFGRLHERAEAGDDGRLREHPPVRHRVAPHDPVELARVERGRGEHGVDDRA
jgi:hypothetical protein